MYCAPALPAIDLGQLSKQKDPCSSMSFALRSLSLSFLPPASCPTPAHTPPTAAAAPPSRRLPKKSQFKIHLATLLTLSPLFLSPSHNISQTCDSAQRSPSVYFQSLSRARSYPDQSPPLLQQSSIHELFPQPITLFRTSLSHKPNVRTSSSPRLLHTVNNPPSNHQHVCYQRGEGHRCPCQ